MCARQDKGYATPERGSMEDFRDDLLNFRGFAANLHVRNCLGIAADGNVDTARPAHLHALDTHNLLRPGPGDAAVAHQIAAERPTRAPGGWILHNPETRRKHPAVGGRPFVGEQKDRRMRA